MNTIYIKTERSQRKIKNFDVGDLVKAMSYGWKLAYKNTRNDYFILTEDDKCLKFNTQTVL